jgi:hypothetical protein
LLGHTKIGETIHPAEGSRTSSSGYTLLRQAGYFRGEPVLFGLCILVRERRKICDREVEWNPKSTTHPRQVDIRLIRLGLDP